MICADCFVPEFWFDLPARGGEVVIEGKGKWRADTSEETFTVTGFACGGGGMICG
jgi:hypothetical protein